MKFSQSIISVSLLVLSRLQAVAAAPVEADASSPNADADAKWRRTTTSYPATISATATSFPMPSSPIGATGYPFARKNGKFFDLGSGTQYFAGSNAWWLGHLQANSDVDNTFTQMTQSKLKLARTWSFGNTNDPTQTYGVFYQILNSTGQYFNFDPNTGIPRLDYVVAAAEKAGIKLTMTLLNNWSGLGGIETYTSAFGCSATTFFSDPKCTAAYKNWIKFIVQRYKASPAVFAWELCNEPRCQGCATSVITNWASSISAYIKSLDAQHFVTIGDEGWFAPPIGDGSIAYAGTLGIDWAANMNIKTIDFGGFHSYPEYWGYNQSWVNTWIMQHDAIGKKLNKPVVYEEYGSSVASPGKAAIVSPWQATVLQNTTIAVDLTWQFGTTLQSANPFDGYAIFYDTVAGSDYDVLVRQHAAKMLAKPAKWWS